MKRIILVCCLFVFTLVSVFSQSSFIQPVNIVSNYAEYHIIAWFEGHEKYECVEAFVYSQEKIRVIFTRHDQSQIDIWNGPVPVSAAFSKRESREGSAYFRLDSNGRDAQLKTISPEGEEVMLIYVGQAEPSSEYGGMTDPGSHAPDGGLPVFFRNKSSVSTKKSYIRFGNTKYSIPVDKEISVPPFFIGYEAFLSTGYYSFIIVTYGKTELPVFTGEQKGIISVSSENERGIKTINTDGGSSIIFSPALPDLFSLEEGKSHTVHFGIVFGSSGKEEVYGTLSAEKTTQGVILYMNPEYPSWAQKRRLKYAIEIEGESVSAQCSMNSER
ncbi:MAG TPA: hypothetical protein PLV89_11140 [Treponemataceae bacterium]|nr:hypothetical protein [Treponemataceae bacterium]